MTENSDSYPMWYCPVWFCPFRTHYKHNIYTHLHRVHESDIKTIIEEQEKFWDAYESGDDLICNKPDSDPTKPDKMRGGLRYRSI